jgi:hypothetical protein
MRISYQLNTVLLLNIYKIVTKLYALTNKLLEGTAEQTANSETVVHTGKFLTVIILAVMKVGCEKL